MRLTACLLTVVVAGCAHKGAGPRQQMLSLGGHLAKYRDWKGVDVCSTDLPALKKELTAMDDLLLEFVTATSGGAQGTWTDEQIALLEEGTRELPPALEATGKLLSAMGKCQFPSSAGLSDPKSKGQELVAQVQATLEKAPELIPLLKAKVVLTKWKTEQAAAIESARGEWCVAGAKLKPGQVADIFYAVEDETGKTEWLFCDDVKVSVEGTAKPTVTDPEGAKKKVDHKKYADAALKYPASEIQHAPKVGAMAGGADGGTAEPAPVADGGTAAPPPAEEKKPEEKKVEEKKPEEKKAEEPKAEKKKDTAPEPKKGEKHDDLKPDD